MSGIETDSADLTQTIAGQFATLEADIASFVSQRDALLELLDANNVRITTLQAALQASVKLQSHYAALLNAYDGGRRLQFADADAWMARRAALDEATGK